MALCCVVGLGRRKEPCAGLTAAAAIWSAFAAGSATPVLKLLSRAGERLDGSWLDELCRREETARADWGVFAPERLRNELGLRAVSTASVVPSPPPTTSSVRSSGSWLPPFELFSRRSWPGLAVGIAGRRPELRTKSFARVPASCTN